VAQEHFVHQVIELLQVGAEHVDEVVGLTGQRPYANHFVLLLKQQVKRVACIRVVPGQGDFDEGLDSQPEVFGAERARWEIM